MAAKRSPILGYNHNVKYRGLVFHVQTEDSGVLSPHLFTHLFHGGVIVSTRKLVYDSGSAEDSIKALMQAQHKAVLKDLRKGSFDDKIDAYLGGTPGLLPRDAGADTAATEEPPSRDSEPVIAGPSDTQPIEKPPLPPPSKPTPSSIPVVGKPTPASGAVVVVTPPRTPSGSQPISTRTITADRTSPRMTPPAPTPIVHAATIPNMGPPSPEGIDTPTLVDASAVAAAMHAKTRMDLGPPSSMPSDFQVDSSPEITMTLEVDDDEPPVRPRAHRDTEVSTPPQNVSMSQTQSDGIPVISAGRPTPSRPHDSVPPMPPPVPDKRVGASALPPTKSVTRPPAVAVMSRPLSNHDVRERAESDAVEVYAPPPSNADPAPVPASERPGQYSLRRSKPIAVPTPPPPIPETRPNSASQPIPSGLARPGQSRPFMRPNPTIQEPVGQPPRSAQRAESAQNRPVPRPAESTGSFRHTPEAASTTGIRRGNSPSSSGPTVTPDPDRHPEHRSRTPTPARVAPARTASTGPSPVVMTRPAVIVGAPAKTTPPRVRKAREEEGRGFGQGLISEKSLDEVILAYLSEDAEDK